MNLSDAFDAPVPFKENGLDLSFPKLDLDDHAKWCRELHEQRKPIRTKMIPGNTPPADRARMLRSIEFDEPGLDDIADLLNTPGGVRTCLDKSLEKAGVEAGQRAATLKKIPPSRAQRLAMDVSGLYESRMLANPPPVQQGGAAPLPAPGESASSPGSTSTGDGPSSSSDSTAVSQSAA